MVQVLTQLSKLATVTASGTVTIGGHNSFNATSGALVATLPPLTSGAVATALAAGQIVRAKISKSKTDTSTNAITVTCAGSDTFESGSTTQALSAAGEKLTLVAQTVAGASGPTWVVEDHTVPRDTLDNRFPQFTNAGRQQLDTVNATALRYFRATLSNRDIARCNVLNIGDSITWGYRQSNSFAINKRWPSLFRDTLRNRFPTNGSSVGGFGYVSPVPTYGATTYSDTMVVNTGGTTGNGYGIALSNVVLSAAGNKQVYTFTGTAADIYYVTYGGGGTFSWAVDAGAATNVSTNATLADLNVIQVRGLAAGTHTITLSWVSGSGVFLDGLYVYNGDETSGIGSTVSAWPGVPTTYWTQKTNWANNFSDSWMPPALVTICIGANDASSSTDWISPTLYKSNLQAIIATVKSRLAYKPSFVLMPVWSVTPYSANPALWTDYVQAQYAVAAADPDGAVAVFDLYRRVNTGAATADTAGILDGSDHIHPSQPLGTRFIAESLASFVAPQ